MLTTLELKKNIKYIVVIGIGLISIFGKLIQSEKVMGLGFISAASPLPLVFSNFRGVEGFALTYKIDYLVNDSWKRLDLGPKVYQKLAGPYNRRNAYGASIAGVPMLTKAREKKLLESIHQYGFCKGHLIREFNIKGRPKKFIINIASSTQGDNRTWKVEIDCHD